MSTYKERYEERKKNKSGDTYQSRYLKRKVERGELDIDAVGKDLSNRVNTWLDNNQKYFIEANTRFLGDNSSYRADASDWLNSATSRNRTFQTEADSIKKDLDYYAPLLGQDYVDSVLKALNGNLEEQKKILTAANTDLEYWSQWDNEDAWKADYDAFLAQEEQKKANLEYDLVAGKTKIADLEKQLNSIGIMTSPDEDFVKTMRDAYELFGWGDKERLEELEKHMTATNELQELLEDERQRYASAELAQKREGYNALAKESDFALNSQPVSKYVGGEQYNAFANQYVNLGYADYNDLLHGYINGEPAARRVVSTNDMQNGGTFWGYDNSQLLEMTADEVSIYNYVYNTQGKEAAKEYLNFIMSDLNARKRSKEEQYWVAEANESPFLTSIFSVASSPLKTFSFIGQTADLLADGSIDQNAGYNKFAYSNTAIRNAVSEKIEKKWGGVGSFAYQTGMSMADFLLNSAITGGNSTFSSAILGTSAAADTVISAKDRGLSDSQAYTLGVIAGAAELITEKYSLETLLDKTSLDKNALGYLLKNILAEGSEEVASGAINLFADVLVSKDKSEWQALINEYKRQGMDDQKAFWHAVGDQALSLGLDFLGGAISGGVMAGGSIGINAVANKVGNKIEQNRRIQTHGNELIEMGAVDPLVEMGKSVTNNKGITRAVKKVEKKATAKNVGNLSLKILKNIGKTTAQLESALVKEGLSQSEAKLVAKYSMGEDLTDAEIQEVESNNKYIEAVNKALAKVNKPLTKSATSEIIESEATTNEGTSRDTTSVHLRNGGERVDGENTERKILRMESGSGTYSQWEKALRSGSKDRQAFKLRDQGREVAVASLGVSKGSKIHTVKVLDNVENETESMKKARKYAEERGLTIKFFVGGNLIIEEDIDANVGKADADKEYYEANGYIRGKVMLVRADHYKFTADQIARHEAAHDKIKKGEVNLKEVKAKLSKMEHFDKVTQAYAEAYEGSGYNEDQIFEEMVCDSLGEMNIFAYGADAELMSTFIPVVQSEVAETSNAPNQTRGSPKVEGKASRIVGSPGDGDPFWRIFANKTSRIVDGEKELLEINGADRVYFVIADGYMSGKIIKSVSNKRPNVYKKTREKIYARNKQSGAGASIWSKLNTTNRGRNIDYSGVFGHGGNATRNGILSENIPERNRTRNQEGGRPHSDRNEEVNKLLDQLRASLNSEVESHIVDENDSREKEIYDRLKALIDKGTQGKASRELDSALDRLTNIKTELNEVRTSIKNIESSDDYKSMMDKLSEAISSDNVAEGLQAYEAWKKETGYGELMQRRDELTSQYDKTIREYEKHRVADAINTEKEAIEKSGLSEAEYFRKQAVKEFGYTPYYYDAGYIVPNGKMLNFSGEKGQHFGSRGQDHRAIGIVYANTQGTDALVRFMNDGNIRIMAESPGLDINSKTEPTSEQYSTIRGFINKYADREYFNIDLSDENGRVIGSLEYEGRINSTRIINDLKHYYATGEIRSQSEVSKLHFSREFNTQRSYAPTFYSQMGKEISQLDALVNTSDKNSSGKASRELDVINYMDAVAIAEGREMYDVKPPSDRERLANALESVAQNDIERKKLNEYKANIEKMNAESEKLKKLKAEIKELTFGKGKKDPQKLKALREEATKTENRINTYDKKLLNLEASTVLKDILLREKKKAYQKAAAKGRETLHKNVEGRNKTAMRHKIQDVAHRLDKLLNHATKERNVKKGQSALVRRALDLTDLLFASDDDLLMNGIETELTDAEIDAMNKYIALYNEYHSYDEAVTENKERRKELRSEMNEVKKGFEGALERERKRISKAKSTDVFNALIAEYDKLAQSEDRYIKYAFDAETKKYLEGLRDTVGDTLVKDMTLNQLEAVYKAFRMIEKMISDSNKMFNETIKASAEELGTKTRDEVMAHKRKDKFTALGKAYSELSWNNLKPIYLMERIGSKTLQMLFDNILEGESTFATYVAEAQNYMDEQKKKYNFKNWDFKKKWKFTTKTGLEFELDLGQLLTIYAYAQRGEQALNHLRMDGFVFDKVTVIEKGVKYELNDKTAYKLDDDNIFKITGNPFTQEKGILTDEQIAYVTSMQKYLSETLGKRGNEVSNKMYGIDLFTEENYLPIISEGAYLERVREQANGTPKIKNRGMTKPTTPGAKNPIVLFNFNELWSKHSVEMNEYAALTLPLEDFYKVYNYTNKSSEDSNKNGVIPAIENTYGKDASKAIDQLLTDLNGGARTDYREGIVKGLTGAFKKAKVMLSASVIVQQPSSILRAQAVIDPKYFVGEKLSKQKHKEAWEELKKYAPVAIIKEMGYFDVGMGRTTADWIMNEPDWKDRLDEITSKGAAYADEVTWIAIWNAVKRETLHTHKDLTPNSKEFLEAAGKRFEKVIRLTQVYDSTLSRSAYMRSKSAMVQMLTAFMAEPTTSLNMREMALRSGDTNRIIRTTAAVYASALLNAILVAFPYAMRDDDEDETFVEKYISALTTNFVGNVNPLTSIPFIKDIWSIAQGYSVERADMTLVDDFISSMKSVITESAKEETDPKALTNAIINLVGDFANMTGIPVKNLVREIKAMINFGKTVYRGDPTTFNSLMDALEKSFQEETPIWGWLPKETKKEKIIEAIQKGDKTYVERFKSSYEDEKSFYSAVKSEVGDLYRSGKMTSREAEKILKKYGGFDKEEADNDIYWLIKEWDYKKKHGKDAEYSKYTEWYEAVKTGRNIKSVIQDYTSHGVDAETLASQITKYYKPLYIKMSKSERASIKGYLLNAYALLGYNRSEKSRDIDKWLKG